MYVGGPSALVLVAGSLLLEAPAGMLAGGQALLASSPGYLLRASAMSAAVNLTSYLAIATTSSLTFKVAGCLKNLGVVWWGVAMHGDTVTPRHMMGYLVSMAGFALYSGLKAPAVRASSSGGGGRAAAAAKKGK